MVAADSQPLTLLGLTRTIEQTPELELLDTATDGPGALALIETRHPQVAAIGARLEGCDGREVARLVRAQRLSTRILLISEHHTGELVLQCLTSGADGFVSKRDSPESVRRAILQVARGHSALPEHVGPEVALALNERRELDDFAPSPRELEVLEQISQGATAADVGRLLQLSTPTVKSYIQNLYIKLGVNDRAAAVAVAIRRGLI